MSGMHRQRRRRRHSAPVHRRWIISYDALEVAHSYSVVSQSHPRLEPSRGRRGAIGSTRAGRGAVHSQHEDVTRAGRVFTSRLYPAPSRQPDCPRSAVGLTGARTPSRDFALFFLGGTRYTERRRLSPNHSDETPIIGHLWPIECRNNVRPEIWLKRSCSLATVHD